MFIEDRWVRRYLDLAIFALNPRERWPAHITLAGPYAAKRDVPRSLVFDQQVSVLGRGAFQNGRNHTIFLRVGSRDMAARMHKPDYKDAVPHLSLYNGRDGALASLLFDVLGHERLFGRFETRNLEIIESKQQFSFNFPLYVNTEILDATKGMSIEDLRALTMSQRVDIAVESIKVALSRPFSLREALDRPQTSIASTAPS